MFLFIFEFGSWIPYHLIFQWMLCWRPLSLQIITYLAMGERDTIITILTWEFALYQIR